MNTPAQSPAEVRAFAVLNLARAELARCEAAVRMHRNVLRRWARQQGYRVVEARWRQCAADRSAWEMRLSAEQAHRSALRSFRTAAMIAALERVVATDRRLNAA